MELLHGVVAPSDPFTYFSLIDLLCRKWPDILAASVPGRALFYIDGLLVGKGRKELLPPTWQHHKAFLSAYASWAKVCVFLMQSPAALAPVSAASQYIPGASEVALGASSRGVSVADVLVECCIGIGLSLSVGLPMTAKGHRVLVREILEQHCQPTSQINSSTHLVQLLLHSRVLLVAGEQLVGVKPASNPGNSSSSSRCRGSRGWGSAGSSSTGMSGADELWQQEDGSFDGRGSRGARDVSGPVKAIRCLLDGLVGPEETLLRKLLCAALVQMHGLYLWHGRAVHSSSSSTRIAPAELPPKRWDLLPLQGLPEAVLKQLDWIWGVWRENDLASGLTGEAEQRCLLQDVLLLLKLLVQEVALPLGCSNLKCVSMNGASEVAAASKSCSGCKVVRYCSMECHVAHWGEHRPLCKQLQQQTGQHQQQGDGKQQRDQTEGEAPEQGRSEISSGEQVQQQQQEGASSSGISQVCGNSNCSRSGERVELKRCSGCSALCYCSILCQRKHWKEHKAHCNYQKPVAS